MDARQLDKIPHGYTSIVKITEAALNGDKKKALFWTKKYLEEFPENGQFSSAFSMLLTRLEDPSLSHNIVFGSLSETEA
jgi:hypothetical protein